MDDDRRAWPKARRRGADAPYVIAACVAAALAFMNASYGAEAGFDEWPEDWERKALAVNEGELVFVSKPTGKTVHHHHNSIVITPESLTSGWVQLKQCHQHLDAVERVEIVFNLQKITALAIVEVRDIGKAWVEGGSVQLEDVGKNAYLCLTARSRALEHTADGMYVMRNGPYMRKYLDGYYPMHFTMDVEFPKEALRWVDIQPKVQPGFVVKNSAHAMRIEGWFEGKLTTEIRFQDVSGIPTKSP